MPGSESPPPFAIRFKVRPPRGPGEPAPPRDPREPPEPPGLPAPLGPEARLYQQALALTEHVAALLDGLATARFQLRLRLDAQATRVALACGAAAGEPSPSARRAQYRAARPLATECATILDILAVQARGAGAPLDPARLDDARALLTAIGAGLAQLAGR